MCDVKLHQTGWKISFVKKGSTLFLQVLSADNLYKQFVARSARQNDGSDLDPN